MISPPARKRRFAAPLADFDRRGQLGSAPKLSTKPLKWRRLPGFVRHVFTHFPLELEIYAARVATSIRAPKGARFVKLSRLADEALSALMRKVLAHAASLAAKPEKAA